MTHLMRVSLEGHFQRLEKPTPGRKPGHRFAPAPPHRAWVLKGASAFECPQRRLHPDACLGVEALWLVAGAWLVERSRSGLEGDVLNRTPDRVINAAHAKPDVRESDWGGNRCLCPKPLLPFLPFSLVDRLISACFLSRSVWSAWATSAEWLSGHLFLRHRVEVAASLTPRCFSPLASLYHINLTYSNQLSAFGWDWDLEVAGVAEDLAGLPPCYTQCETLWK